MMGFPHKSDDNPSLEERLSDVSPSSSSSPANSQQASAWDFFTSAYASGKAVKTLLYSLAAGYSPKTALTAAAGIYTGLKLAGKGLKTAFNYLTGRPVQYSGFRKELGSLLEELNPLGKYRLPTGLGAGISWLSYLTGY